MNIVCPNCASTSVKKQGSAARPDRYRCKNCGREFTNRRDSLRKINILALDIETLPMKFYAWSPWNQNLGRHQLIEDWSLLSFSAKWVGEDRIISNVLTPTEALQRDDSRLAWDIQNLLDQANIVVTHNGKRFDIRKINTRLWKYKLPKPSSYRVIDTLVTARQVFGMTYNSMDYIAEFVERDRKLDHNHGLWVRADHGEQDALTEMLEYNDQDVRTQEQIYMEMREWIPNHPNIAIIAGDPNACPVCLHKGHKKIGFHYTNKKQYKEYRCNACGATWHSSKAEK